MKSAVMPLVLAFLFAGCGEEMTTAVSDNRSEQGNQAKGEMDATAVVPDNRLEQGNQGLREQAVQSQNDKIISAHIDQMLVPRIRTQEAISVDEIDELKKTILTQIHQLPEENQVQAADYLIQELIRMHNL